MKRKKVGWDHSTSSFAFESGCACKDLKTRYIPACAPREADNLSSSDSFSVHLPEQILINFTGEKLDKRREKVQEKPSGLDRAKDRAENAKKARIGR
ncbi:Hypothetical protein NTJ_09995 [Nesidiocoris tenuis]|uniref:Uncharacterized protein n=1 Tax=Nesidiocoris tenuis TaxID=355587 RepID=A0ABN7AYB5_9HEMI|nr:Hypothetical protein NTJ_09995 [Nesidiocoris tenuis]